MASLAFTFPIQCLVCGHIETGMVHMFGARINKTSVRVDRSLTTSPRACRECGWPMPDSIPNPRMRPDEESARIIAETRRKKGWAA